MKELSIFKQIERYEHAQGLMRATHATHWMKYKSSCWMCRTELIRLGLLWKGITCKGME